MGIKPNHNQGDVYVVREEPNAERVDRCMSREDVCNSVSDDTTITLRSTVNQAVGLLYVYCQS